MTASIVFDEIDYSQIEYDANSTDSMLTDPSASIIARVTRVRTRETGDEVITPDITGRTNVSTIDFNETSYEEYKMRRKAEVLKYKNNTTINKELNTLL